MNGRYLHCAASGIASVSETDEVQADDVAILPYEAGMKVIVRAVLSNGTKRCATVTVGEFQDGESKSIVDMAKAGQGAHVVSCELKTEPKQKKAAVGIATHGEVPLDVEPDADGGTPAALWMSGMKNVPSALPRGRVAFLIMRAEWYEKIESGEKRVEYRKQCKKYRSMFIDHKPVAVKLQYGFTPRQMVWQVLEIEDCGEDGIDICLGKRIQ